MSFRNRALREDNSLPPVASRNKGFTLVETTIAMVVMMVVGLGATSLFLYSVRSNAGGNDRSQALAIAQQSIEELRTLNYNHARLAIGQTTTIIVHDNDVAGASTGAQSYSAGQTYAASAGQMYAASSSSFSAYAAAAFFARPTPTPTPTSTPTPTPTPAGGGGGGGAAVNDDDTYRLVVNVVGLPAGAATPTQKRITITVTPQNGLGANSWINSNPVVIVIHRSNPAVGPYKL